VTAAPPVVSSPTGAGGVAAAARLLATAALVEGFGHVSERHPEDGFLLTSTAPLAHQRTGDVHHVAADGRAPAGGAGVPLERYLHAAVYAVRPDVKAICRTHSPWAVVWGARGAVPPLVHGLGALAGAVAMHDEVDLVADPDAGRRAAASLGTADCLLARGNGALTTGDSLATALTRAWFLEERSRVAYHAAPVGETITVEDPRMRHLAVELPRAWSWLQARFGDDRSREGAGGS